MNKVKVIAVSWPIESEKPINEWLEANPGVRIVSMHTHSNIRLDYYADMQLCNQYYEYTVTILYSENDSSYDKQMD